MMKKGMIRFLATGMTALTLMGTAVAFTPATQVFAAEVETASDTSEVNNNLKIMSVKEADAYVRELVGNADPFEEYDNCKMYKVGHTVYSVKTYDHEPEVINRKFFSTYEYADQKIYHYYLDCLKRGMINGEYKQVGDGAYTVHGIIPTVALAIDIFEHNTVETINITASKTMIRPGECACLQLHVNDGADESEVSWRVIGAEGTTDFYADGSEAFVTGYETGTVMVVAETVDGAVRDYIQINVVDY